MCAQPRLPQKKNIGVVVANVGDVDQSAAVTHVASMISAVFAGVDVLRDLAATLHERAADGSRKPTTADLASIRPTIFDQLSRTQPELAGTGVIAAPGALADQPRWLEWWRRPRGTTQPLLLSVDLDPHHIGGYEYTSTQWFETPRRTGSKIVVGPYVDYAGTDEYILTFASPIISAHGFFGVAAADIRSSDFEQSMLPLLDAAGPRTLLVNASGRVIASNTAETIVGSLIPAHQQRGSHVPADPGSTRCQGLPWSLVTM